jgi:hypothetical protein
MSNSAPPVPSAAPDRAAGRSWTTKRAAWVTALTEPGSLHRREIAIAWAALLVLGALVFGSHIRHGQLSFDDWANTAETLYPPAGPGFGHVLSYFWALTGYRPVLVLYVPLSLLVLGAHATLQIAWASFLAVLIAWLLYGILRTLTLPPIHALMIAVLTIVFPWYDSTRLWASASQASVAIVLYCVGLWLALDGLEKQSMRRHAFAALAYLLSVLCYEVGIPLILAGGLLYWWRFGWRAARWRWLADVIAVVAGALWVGTHEKHQAYGLSGDLTHAREIFNAGGVLIGRSVYALGVTAHTTVPLVALLLVLLTGAAVYLIDRRGAALDGVESQVGRWLAVMVGGLIVTVLGWVMYAPANVYYTPSVYGIVNRTNALAGFGIVVLLYGACGVVGSIGVRIARMAGMPSRRQALATAALTVALSAVLGLTYARVFERHSRIWNAAGVLEQRERHLIEARYPHPAAGTVIFAAGFPQSYTLGVPIFDANYDLNGAMQLAYHSSKIAAYPILTGQALGCAPTGVSLVGGGAAPTVAPYGKARLFNGATGVSQTPESAAACHADAPGFAPGPLYLAATY